MGPAYAALAYVLAVLVVIGYGVAACWTAYNQQRKQDTALTPEFFLTARNSASTLTVTWSFYAAAMGSWALFGPPSFCLTAGILGTITYALFSGLPILAVALFGSLIQQVAPDVISLGDFVRRRFGGPASLYVSLIMAFNMAIGMAAECTALGDLFQHVLALPRLPILLISTAVPMLYSAWGGLYVSIVTDRWQAQASVVAILTLCLYVAFTLPPIDKPLPPDLAWGNYYGRSSLLVMPVALTSTTLLSEAMWQRCWASADSSALLHGSLLASAIVTVAVFLLGFAGLLAVWTGAWVPSSPSDPGNTILFSLIRNDWVLVTVTLLAVTMSESAIGSFQTAIVDTVATAAESATELIRDWQARSKCMQTALCRCMRVCRHGSKCQCSNSSMSILHACNGSKGTGGQNSSSTGIGGCSSNPNHPASVTTAAAAAAHDGAPPPENLAETSQAANAIEQRSCTCRSIHRQGCSDCYREKHAESERQCVEAGPTEPLLGIDVSRANMGGGCSEACTYGGDADDCGAHTRCAPSGPPTAKHKQEHMSVATIRFLVPLLSLPSILLSLLDLNILSLFLVGNIINTATWMPVLAGLIPGPLARHLITPVAAVAGSLSGVLSVLVWVWVCDEWKSVALYDWRPFVLALVFSVIGMAVGRIGEDAAGRFFRWLGSAHAWWTSSDACSLEHQALSECSESCQ